MNRPKRIRNSLYPYHVATRCHNRDWFELPLPKVWWLAQEAFKEAHEKRPVELVSFVLMGNHYHMLIRTPHEDLPEFMYEFNKRLGQKIRFYTKTENQVFGGRYKACLITSRSYLANCFRYVYQNPLRAGLVKRCEDYTFSTLHCLVYNKPFSIPIHDQFGFKDTFNLNWINSFIEEYEIESIRKSFKRAQMSGLTNGVSRKKIGVLLNDCQEKAPVRNQGPS